MAVKLWDLSKTILIYQKKNHLFKILIDENIEREKDLMDINNICPISYGLAQKCANLLSDKMNNKFNVFTSSKPNFEA